MIRRLPLLVLTCCLMFALSAPTLARDPQSNIKVEAGQRFRDQHASATPQVIRTAHGRGNIRLAVANNGTFGTYGDIIPDPFTGDPLPSCEYPRGSDIVFLYVAAMWIGAVVDGDTLVSCGEEDVYATRELWPDLPELGGQFKYGSIDVNSKFYSDDVVAYSEEDILAEYYDTLTSSLIDPDVTDGRRHKPLGVKIKQLSMAWSYEYADDFILFDYEVSNIGEERLRKVYIGIWVDGDTWHSSRNSPEGWEDDISGFYPAHPAPEGCGFIDTVNIAWHADNDGDGMPREDPTAWDYRSATGVVGTRVIRTPSDSLDYSFNWWIYGFGGPSTDFGPRMVDTDDYPFRDFGPRSGTPLGDRNKYYVMSKPEFDYDLMWTARDHTEDGFRPPPTNAAEYANGHDCRYLLSFGPFDIEPGQALPVTFAWVGGEDFHQHPSDMASYFNPYSPEVYYDQLNFDNLATNARWASWVYDNPGIDTDGDGYKGKARVCLGEDGAPIDSTEVDSLWYEGDGIPDFRGAGPPPAPRIRVIPSLNKLTVRFNGYYTETEKDIFTQRADFEGYRVYLGLDDRPSSFSVVRSYDLLNYSRFLWTVEAGTYSWVRDEMPHSLRELRCLHADSCDDPSWDPLHYTNYAPLVVSADTIYYFESQDFNRSDLSADDGIRKVFPDAANPGTDSSAWLPEDLVYDYDERLPKYYEYEYDIEGLLPTVPYFMAVTSFDHGSPNSGLKSLENKPENNYVQAYPQSISDASGDGSDTTDTDGSSRDVYVVPNPYRLDADYQDRGFENRDRGTADPERSRRLQFFNLPASCHISIYSLDGDLIREWDHEGAPDDPTSMHDEWDMITRNSQTIVSGLFYWVVESENRTQVGKIAVIK